MDVPFLPDSHPQTRQISPCPFDCGPLCRTGDKTPTAPATSLLSSTGLAIEDISHLVGHANTRVTETVYRKELRPVLTRGAGAIDALFPRPVGKQIGKP